MHLQTTCRNFAQNDDIGFRFFKLWKIAREEYFIHDV